MCGSAGSHKGDSRAGGIDPQSPEDGRAADRRAAAVFRAAAAAPRAPDRALIVRALDAALDFGAAQRVEGTTYVPALFAGLLGLAALLSAAISGRELSEAGPAAWDGRSPIASPPPSSRSSTGNRARG